MLSSCVALLLVLSAGSFAQEISSPQSDGVYVPQESTFEMGLAPELHLPENMDRSENMMQLKPAEMEERKAVTGQPDEELKPKVTPKPKPNKQRKATIVFPSPNQLFPFHKADQPNNQLPNNQFAQQDANAEQPIFVQQPGGPNGPSSFSDEKHKPVQFPLETELKPFHFGDEHQMRLQYQFGAQQPPALQQGQLLQPFQFAPEMNADHPFMGQDAPQPQFTGPTNIPEAPQPPMMGEIHPFQFAPRDQPQWDFVDAPQPQFDDTQPEMPQWAMQPPPQLQYAGDDESFQVPARFHRRHFGPPPPPPMMYEQFDGPVDRDYAYGNRVEQMMEDLPSDYDNSPLPPFPMMAPRFHHTSGRWNRHRRYW